VARRQLPSAGVGGPLPSKLLAVGFTRGFGRALTGGRELSSGAHGRRP